jgi:tyrosine-protein kinase Etk/Wzc
MDPSNSPTSFHQPGDESLDLKRYISLFISNWYWFAITLFITLVIAYGINRYSEKVYTVSATLLIKDDQIGRVSNAESVIPGGDIFKSQQNLKNEIGILQSFRLNDSVMKRLPEFHVVYVSIGRRGIVETRMYKSSPFMVIYDSLETQRSGKLGIEFLSDSTYRIELEGTLLTKTPGKIGELYNENGFDFKVIPRFKGSKVCRPRITCQLLSK